MRLYLCRAQKGVTSLCSVLVLPETWTLRSLWKLCSTLQVSPGSEGRKRRVPLPGEQPPPLGSGPTPHYMGRARRRSRDVWQRGVQMWTYPWRSLDVDGALQRHSLTGTPLLSSTGQEGCLELRSEMSLRACVHLHQKMPWTCFPPLAGTWQGTFISSATCQGWRPRAMGQVLCSLIQSNEML